MNLLKIEDINTINFDEGIVKFILNDYYNINDYPLYLFIQDVNLKMYIIKINNYHNVSFKFLPPSISTIKYSENFLCIIDYSENNNLKVSGNHFEVYSLGKIPIKNPYQLLIDLDLIKL